MTERSPHTTVTDPREERYRLLVEQATDGIFVADRSGRYVEVNPAGCELLGYSREELLEMRLPDVVAPQERARQASFVGGIVDGELSRTERLMLRKDGSTVHVEIASGRMSDGCLQAIVRDVSARKRAEAELQRRDAILAAIAYVSGELFRLPGPDAVEAVLRHLGEAAGVSHALLVIPASGRGLGASEWHLPDQPALVARLDEPGAGSGEGRLPGWASQLRSGSVIAGRRTDFAKPERDALTRLGVQSVVAVPLLTDEEVVGCLAFVETRSEREWSAAELDALRAAARVLSAALERDRDQERLARSEAHLREAQKLEAVGRLAGGIAHDFNNLLTAIRGFAELHLAAHATDDPGIGDIVEIQRAAERATDRTKQLLAFSRRLPARLEPLDLGIVVTASLPLLQRLVGTTVEIVTALEPGCPMVLADRGEIEHALVNLVTNSRDAMPASGRITITIARVTHGPGASPRPAEPDGADVLLSVADDGVGMDAATTAYLFEPFSAARPSDCRMGLGLPTVYETVRRAGGTIGIESRPGEGTIVRIRLPGVGIRETTQEASPIAPPVLTRAAAKRILVVEDEPEVRAFVERVLEEHGYEVRSYGCPGLALEFARAHPGSFDALVTDVVMPGMSGPALAADLAADLPGLPVLFMSGFDPDGPGSRSTLAKPFTAAELAARVGVMLGKEGGLGPATGAPGPNDAAPGGANPHPS